MALGVSLGAALGVSLGLVFDNLAVGIAIGVSVGAAIGAALERPSGHTDAGGDGREREDGSVARALMWLFVGLAVLVALIVLTAPELVWTDPAATSELLLFATIAGVPGLALLLWLAYRRRGEDVDTSPSHHPEGHPDQRDEG